MPILGGSTASWEAGIHAAMMTKVIGRGSTPHRLRLSQSGAQSTVHTSPHCCASLKYASWPASLSQPLRVHPERGTENSLDSTSHMATNHHSSPSRPCASFPVTLRHSHAYGLLEMRRLYVGPPRPPSRRLGSVVRAEARLAEACARVLPNRTRTHHEDTAWLPRARGCGAPSSSPGGIAYASDVAGRIHAGRHPT